MIASSSRMLRSSSTTSTRVSGMTGGQGKGERRTEARRALDVDLAAVLLDDAVDQRESESGAFGFRGEEGLEEVREIGCGDALTVVAHRDLQPIATDRGADPQLAALRHRLDRVQAEVPQDLPELLRVHRPHHRRRELANDLEAP